MNNQFVAQQPTLQAVPVKFWLEQYGADVAGKWRMLAQLSYVHANTVVAQAMPHNADVAYLASLMTILQNEARPVKEVEVALTTAGHAMQATKLVEYHAAAAAGTELIAPLQQQLQIQL